MECSNGSYLTQFLIDMYTCSLSCNIVFLHISTPSVNNKDRRQNLINAKLIYYKYCIVIFYNHINLQWNVPMVHIFPSSCINMYTCSRVLQYCFLAHFYLVTFECGYNNYMYTCPGRIFSLSISILSSSISIVSPSNLGIVGIHLATLSTASLYSCSITLAGIDAECLLL